MTNDIDADQGLFTHIPVLLDEAVGALAIVPDGVYVDGTFGRGGHSQKILQQLGAAGRLWVFDKDPQAIRSASALKDRRMEAVHGNFAEMARVLCEHGAPMVDGVLLDLGISSPQIDDATRGFSYRFDAPLDMRMDNSQGISAQEWLASADEITIKKVIYEYSEERFSGQIAKKIVATRADRTISTTRELAQIIHASVKGGPGQQDSTSRTFQAIRIHINQELAHLKDGLKAASAVLKPGGRLAVISFHSLEDRIVKQFMRGDMSRGTVKATLRGVRFLPPETLVSDWCELRKYTASEAERSRNPRARSAVLRVATKR